MTYFLRNSWKSEIYKGTEANADERYAFIGRNFSSSSNGGVLIYQMLISSVGLHFPHAYAFVS